MNAPLIFLLTFLAYTPLWLMIAIRDLNAILLGNSKTLVAEWTGLGMIAVCGLIGSIRVCLASKKNFYAEESDFFKIISCKEKKTVTVRFVIENVLPMLVFNPTTAEGLALTLAYFLVIASLAVRHRHFSANVVVEWLGWTFYECKLESQQGEDTQTRTVLSRDYLGGTNQFRRLFKINNETLVETPRKGAKYENDGEVL